jgi:two-component system chemotaxis response regulator CheB
MTAAPAISVLVAEDSPMVSLLLCHILRSDPALRVVGTAADGAEAVDAVARLHPDCVLMDVNMPRLDGYAATRLIMESNPVPIIMCSAALKREEVENTFRALEAGAVAFIDKPTGPGHPQFAATVAALLQAVKTMSHARVRRQAARPGPAMAAALLHAAAGGVPPEVVLIGASTGGPPVLLKILGGLPGCFPLPLLIVQHIAAGFLDGMLDWLGHKTGRTVRIAESGEQPRPGVSYFAPDGRHLGLAGDGLIHLSDAPPEHGVRPSVSHLFRSAAGAQAARTAAVLLSGMGADGARELKELRDRGAVTIVQEEGSCVVPGMPGEAIRLGAATHVMPPERIADMLAALASQRKGVAP